MIIPEAQYPGKVAPGNASYPYGGPQNVTVPGDGTGTPWEAALVSDFFGVIQAVVQAAGVIPSGSPETAQTSQVLDAHRTISGDISATRAVMVAKNLKIGATATTLGRTAVGDGSGGTYRIVASQPLGDGDVGLSNGNTAVLQKGYFLDSLQFNPAGLPAAEMDTTVEGSHTVAGTAGLPNKLGVNNTAPVTGGFANDTGYVAGEATVAAIMAGYDNVNNALAGLIASQHAILYSLTDHSTIIGGSIHQIQSGSQYAGIFGGTLNTIEPNCSYSGLVMGEQNTLKDGGTVDTSGFRAVIIGGVLNVSWGRNSAICGGEQNLMDRGAHYAFIAGRNNTVGGATTGLSSFAFGEFNSVNLTVGNRAGAFGNGNTVNGTNSYAFGGSHEINHDRCTSTGFATNSPTNGYNLHSSRNRGNVTGNNQRIEFQCSNETTGDTVQTSLSIFGSSGYPIQPEDSTVDGVFQISGTDVATGDVYSAELSITTKRVGAANPTIEYTNLTTKATGITPLVAPLLNVTTGGIYRVQLKGESGKTIAWDAVFTGHQVVYA